MLTLIATHIIWLFVTIAGKYLEGCDTHSLQFSRTPDMFELNALLTSAAYCGNKMQVVVVARLK